MRQIEGCPSVQIKEMPRVYNAEKRVGEEEERGPEAGEESREGGEGSEGQGTMALPSPPSASDVQACSIVTQSGSTYGFPSLSLSGPMSERLSAPGVPTSTTSHVIGVVPGVGAGGFPTEDLLQPHAASSHTGNVYFNRWNIAFFIICRFVPETTASGLRVASVCVGRGGRSVGGSGDSCLRRVSPLLRRGCGT